MSLWRQLTRGLRTLTNPTAADQDVVDEVQDYLDRATAAHMARGLSQEDAHRAARQELGSLTSVTQQLRECGWEHVIDTFVADLRYGARRLRAAPAFTAVTMLTLALGIGATTAIFSAVKPILLEPLPYPEAHRITMIWEVRPDGVRADGTFGMYRGLVERARSFEEIAVFKAWQPILTGRDQPERLDGQRVSASYFQVLGVSPILGRPFAASDDRVNGPNVIVLSDALWQRRFGGDPTIIGRQITLDGGSHLVVGIMPRDFENVLGPSAALWAPMQYGMSQGRTWGHHLQTVGRLRPGVSLDQAATELNLLGQAVLDEQHPATYRDGVQFLTTSLQDDVTRDVKPTLLISFGAVILVLVIACVNVTNLLLARAVNRRDEFTLRAALGAPRRRLIRQFLTESLLLAVLGGVAGIAVAGLGVRALMALSPPNLPRAGAISVDTMVLAFALGIVTLVGLAIGAIPALQTARNDRNTSLPQATPRTTRRLRGMRSALVVSEVSLALVLLVSSGLLWQSLERLFAVRTGFETTDLLTLQVQTSGSRFKDSGTTSRFFAQALGAVRQVPGVTAAALTSQLPLSGDVDLYGVHFDPVPPDDPGEMRGSFRYSVSPGYIETMRIPLLRGRLFDERDREGTLRVALISESMARRRLPGRDAIGQRLRIGPTDGPLYTVVGVVGDVKQMSLALNESEAVYTTEAQWRFADTAMSLVVRTHGDAAALVPALRQAIWSVDKDQPIIRVAMMDDLLAGTEARRRFALSLLQAFALTALILAAAGIYGVLAGSVAERTREIGVRSTLGASRGSILGLVLREGMRLTGCGIALGLAGALAASQALATLLFGTSRLDPLTYMAVIALMVGVSVLACWTPAWRAVRVDPATTLRAE
jgi:putative ABC transport system permease protein